MFDESFPVVWRDIPLSDSESRGYKTISFLGQVGFAPKQSEVKSEPQEKIKGDLVHGEKSTSLLKWHKSILEKS